MGKIIFTDIQQKIVKHVANDKRLNRQYYFTGGTALSVFYYQHRYSEDLDFFSEKPYDEDLIIDSMTHLSKTISMPYQHTKRERVLFFVFTKNRKPVIKVDFAYYPYSRIEKGDEWNGIAVDSLRDIGTNKLLTINQRADVKDFVDLYFFLKKSFTIWDLSYGMEKKFRMELDLFLLGEDFLKINGFTTMPKMIAPLTLTELKSFFRARAKEVGKRALV